MPFTDARLLCERVEIPGCDPVCVLVGRVPLAFPSPKSTTSRAANVKRRENVTTVGRAVHLDEGRPVTVDADQTVTSSPPPIERSTTGWFLTIAACPFHY